VWHASCYIGSQGSCEEAPRSPVVARYHGTMGVAGEPRAPDTEGRVFARVMVSTQGSPA
jgi:hypothetical protein